MAEKERNKTTAALQYYIRGAIKVAKSLQVELNGRYSTGRIQKLATYHRWSTSFSAVVVIVSMAVPCMIVPIFFDFAQLAKPAEGPKANWLLFVREFIMWSVISFLGAGQCRHFVSSLSLTIPQWLLIAFVPAAACAASSYLLSTLIGFPVPFTNVLAAPVWVSHLCSLVALTWRHRFPITPEAKPQIISWLKVWLCQLSLVAIYPGYFYIFTSLPARAQLPFACLLPIIKVLVRNWLSRALHELRDEMSEHVILNADIFSSLFVAYCMQNVPSVWATAGLMAIDGAQIFVAIRDVRRLVRKIDEVRIQLELSASSNARRGSAISREMAPRRSSGALVAPLRINFKSMRNVLEQADTIITQRAGTSSVLVKKRTFRSSTAGTRGYVAQGSAATVVDHVKKPQSSFLCQHWLRKVVLGPSTEHAMVQPSELPTATPGPASPTRATGSTVSTVTMKLPLLERQFLDLVGRLLFLTEFVLLLNFVEVVIPIVYCTFPASRPANAYHSLLTFPCSCFFTGQLPPAKPRVLSYNCCS